MKKKWQLDGAGQEATYKVIGDKHMITFTEYGEIAERVILDSEEEAAALLSRHGAHIAF